MDAFPDRTARQHKEDEPLDEAVTEAGVEIGPAPTADYGFEEDAASEEGPESCGVVGVGADVDVGEIRGEQAAVDFIAVAGSEATPSGGELAIDAAVPPGALSTSGSGDGASGTVVVEEGVAVEKSAGAGTSAGVEAGADARASATAEARPVVYDLDEDGIPRDVAVYREKGYWDFRFQTEEAYEWVADIDQLEGQKEEIVAMVGDKGRCLILGCGNSNLTEKLKLAGLRSDQLVSMDYSEVVIARMKAKYGDECGEWLLGDMTKLHELFPDSPAFQVVLEKCSVDALTAAPGDIWDPNEETRRDVTNVLRGVHHVLAPEGVFVSLTFNQPHFRKPLLLAEGLFDVKMKGKVDIGFKECYKFHLTPK